MSEQPTGEKSFAPTEKRKRDAAKKGDVLRSKEVATAAAVFTGAACLFAGGPWLLESISLVAQAGFTFQRSDLENFSPGAPIAYAMQHALLPIFGLGLAIMLATVASQLLFGEGRFMAANLAPKASRINPLSGLKRMFGPQGWIELGKSMLKVILLGAIAWWWGSSNFKILLGLGRGELSAQLGAAWHSAITLLMLLSAGLVLIAMIDWPIQFIRRLTRLKMTMQEMRDESKESEGSPERKGAQRQRQREIARGGVARAMKDAQFVLTNPTHFAVALTYDPAIAPAPVVLAKGRGDKALAMRELAAENSLPVLEYPALARSVYYTTRENQVIREELYIAVAAIVAFVLSLKRGERPKRPQVEVPVALRFDAEGRAQAA